MDGIIQGREAKNIWLSVKKNRDLILHSLMCSIGGFMGGYAVLCRGNLGSAQTINMIDIVLDVMGRNRSELILRVIGLLLYILGIESVVLLSRKSATVFSTNNLRQMLLALNDYAFDRDRKQLNKALYFFNSLFWFYINVAVSYYTVKHFGIHASLFGFIYAVPAMVITFIKEDKVSVVLPSYVRGLSN